MADLLVKVGAGASYEDGDILNGFNRRRIRCVHAEELCHLKHEGYTYYGLRDLNALARDLREACCQYRFERVSPTEVERVTIATGDRQLFSDIPVLIDGKWQAIDVGEFLKRRVRHPRHGIFGSPGAEIWYGGREDRSHAALDQVWTAIETKTPRRESEAGFQKWPAGRQDLKSHLMLKVDEFDDSEGDTLTSSEVDETDPANPIVTRKRRFKVDIAGSLPLSAAQLEALRDIAVTFDGRLLGELPRLSIILQKMI